MPIYNTFSSVDINDLKRTSSIENYLKLHYATCAINGPARMPTLKLILINFRPKGPFKAIFSPEKIKALKLSHYVAGATTAYAGIKLVKNYSYFSKVIFKIIFFQKIYFHPRKFKALIKSHYVTGATTAYAGIKTYCKTTVTFKKVIF